MKPIYLDHAATTPTDSRVVETMIPWLRDDFGNASSIHTLGRKAQVAVELAREQLASYLVCTPAEIIFTSGGTESDNTVIHLLNGKKQKNELITSNAEHHAILHPAEQLEQYGRKVQILEVNSDGVITPEKLREQITEQTGLVSLMHVNNENGAITDINELSRIAHAKGALFHTDAVQSAGKMPLSVEELQVDSLSISGHKLYGPKGIGVLYVKAGTEFEPFMSGGSQERKRRAGTLNVAGIIGLGKAIELAQNEMEERTAHISETKSYFQELLLNTFGDFIRFNNPIGKDAYHIVNISFTPKNERYLDGEMLLLNLDIEGIYCSNGSACTSGAVEPSHVLLAMGIHPKIAKSSLRFSLGKDNTKEEMERVTQQLHRIVTRMGLFS